METQEDKKIVYARTAEEYIRFLKLASKGWRISVLKSPELLKEENRETPF